MTLFFCGAFTQPVAVFLVRHGNALLLDMINRMRSTCQTKLAVFPFHLMIPRWAHLLTQQSSRTPTFTRNHLRNLSAVYWQVVRFSLQLVVNAEHLEQS